MLWFEAFYFLTLCLRMLTWTWRWIWVWREVNSALDWEKSHLIILTLSPREWQESISQLCLQGCCPSPGPRRTSIQLYKAHGHNTNYTKQHREQNRKIRRSKLTVINKKYQGSTSSDWTIKGNTKVMVPITVSSPGPNIVTQQAAMTMSRLEKTWTSP